MTSCTLYWTGLVIIFYFQETLKLNEENIVLEAMKNSFFSYHVWMVFILLSSLLEALDNVYSHLCACVHNKNTTKNRNIFLGERGVSVVIENKHCRTLNAEHCSCAFDISVPYQHNDVETVHGYSNQISCEENVGSLSENVQFENEETIVAHFACPNKNALSQSVGTHYMRVSRPRRTKKWA